MVQLLHLIGEGINHQTYKNWRDKKTTCELLYRRGLKWGEECEIIINALGEPSPKLHNQPE